MTSWGQCREPGCGQPSFTRGLCRHHYYRPPPPVEGPAPAPGDECAVDGCEGVRECRGWCHTHYSQARIRFHKIGEWAPTDGTEPRLYKRAPLIACKTEGCGRVVSCRGWCDPHYYRAKKIFKATGEWPT